MKTKLREFLQSGVVPFRTERNSNPSKNDRTKDSKLCYVEECSGDEKVKATQDIRQTRTKHRLKIENAEYFLPFISERSSTGKTLSTQLSNNNSSSCSSKPKMSTSNRQQQKQSTNKNSILNKLKISTMDSISNITNLDCNSSSQTDHISSKARRNNQDSIQQQQNEYSNPLFCSLSTSSSKENLRNNFSLFNQSPSQLNDSEDSFMEQSSRRQLFQPYFLSPNVLQTQKYHQQLQGKNGEITQKLLLQKTKTKENIFATQISQSSEDNNSYQSTSPHANPIISNGSSITNKNYKHYKLNQPPAATEYLQRLAESKKQHTQIKLVDNNTKIPQNRSYQCSFGSSSRSRQQQFCQSPKFFGILTPKQPKSTPPPLGTYTLNYKLVSKTVPICKIQGLRKQNDSQNHQDLDNNQQDKASHDRSMFESRILKKQDSEEGFEKMYFNIIKQIKADVSNQIKKSGGKQLHPANSLGMPEKYINAEEIMKIDAEFRAKVKKQREKLNKIKLFLVFFQNK